MKKLLLGIILLTSLNAIHCECPLNIQKKWQLQSQETVDEGTKTTTKKGYIGVVSKDEVEQFTNEIKNTYPITEEKTEIVKKEKTDKIKNTILCSENITILPNGLEWINFAKNKYKTNKYDITSQYTFKKINCTYFEGEETDFSTPLGWDEDIDSFYQNKCAEENIGSEKECKDKKGIILERFQDGCKERICYRCQKEDEDFEELLDDEKILFEWTLENDLSEKCNDKIEVQRRKCFEKFRCVKEII